MKLKMYRRRYNKIMFMFIIANVDEEVAENTKKKTKKQSYSHMKNKRK